MKKNLISRKTMLTARVLLIFLLLTSALGLSACGNQQVNKGQYYDETYTDHSISLKIVSDTKRFDFDDIIFQAYIGLHKRQYSLIDWIITDKDLLMSKTNDISEVSNCEKNLYYIVYATNRLGIEYGASNENILDYAYILKEISLAESFEDGKYNFAKIPFGDYYYNHCEDIVIPKECILETLYDEYREIYVGICIAEKNEQSEKYSIPIDNVIMGWSYHINDEGMLEIDLYKTK